ncbi:MAG TPA: D-alanyl-D-alanine carboxypeptidase/D-alanyl-D-alanine-endopeptidase [Candidatus Cybelea sp.]|jgi:D-alanyl-D-alanine carboxypeptidase/D-alanyl-D-alanine-endopeptidase (penicillin-binding protein 4)|nr:D-alanyl-D-alanine carboxypeptidase/D-alanyl-D-alanine-endopeptidase [Candidatus Cybelea sp.]
MLLAIGALAAQAALPAPFVAGRPWNDGQIASLRARLDRALRLPALRGAHVGLLAVDTQRGTPLYAREDDAEFAPASTFKLLAGSAALRYLEPGFRFVTSVSAGGTIAGGTLEGNLYLHGGGDAHLSAADLHSAAAALYQSGIRRVEGALITDASHDDAERYPAGWSWDDLPYGYAAVVCALELEEGIVHVYVTPGSAAGAPVSLRVEPASTAFVIENRATTGTAGSADSTDIERPWDSPLTIRVTGSYPAGASESDDLAASVPDPQRYAGDVFRDALNAAGVSVAGAVREGGPSQSGTTQSGTTLWRHESSPLPQLLAEFWLPSDNLMGELILKELGIVRAGEPGTYANGIALEREYLRWAGIDPATVSIADGSGLSVYDRITPRDLVTILQSDWNGPSRASVVAALPETGVRGTLQTLLPAGVLDGKVFAKTGSMRHTRALAGFVATPAHGPVTFSLLVNDWLGDDGANNSALTRAQGAILAAFLEADSP